MPPQAAAQDKATRNGRDFYSEFALPPLEYDHPYQGDLTVTRADRATLDAKCPRWPWTVIGCTLFPGPGRCEIVIATDEILEANFPFGFEVFFRHERGHCVGWPNNHPNPRHIKYLSDTR